MVNWLRCLGLALAAVLTLAMPAEARDKRAFIVGVGEYAELPDLLKTDGDAQGYAGLFKDDLGFDEVTILTDPTRVEFLGAFGTFLERIGPEDEVFFVFSGHGWSDGAENYLVMSDAPKSAPQYVVKLETVALNNAVLSQIRARSPRALVAIIDACRDNPFEGQTRSGMGRGLVRVDPGAGTLVMFSAGARQTALDRLSQDDPSPYSVFTRVLLPKLKDGGRPLQDIAREVKSEVMSLAAGIDHDQLPAYYDELVGDYCIWGRCTSTVGDDGIDADTRLWLDVTAGEYGGENACPGYQLYLDTFPNGQFASRASRLLSFPPCSAPEEEDLDTARFLEITGGAQMDTSSTCSAYERYLMDFPEGKYRVRVSRLLGAPPCVPEGTSVELGANAPAGPDVPVVEVTEVFSGTVASSRSPSFIDGPPLTFGATAATPGAAVFTALAPALDGGQWAVGTMRPEAGYASEIVRFDADGDLLSRWYYGEDRGASAFLETGTNTQRIRVWDLAHEIRALAPDANGDLFMVGYSGPNRYGTKYPGMITKLMADGEVGWTAKTFEGDFTNFNAVVALPDGGVLAAGEASTAGEDGERAETAIVVRTDAYGREVWRATPTGQGKASAAGMILSPYAALGEVWIAGWTRRDGADGNAVYFARLSLETGEVVEERAWETEGSSQAVTLVPALDEGAWVVGQEQDAMQNPQASSLLVARVNAEGVRTMLERFTDDPKFRTVYDAVADPKGGVWIAGMVSTTSDWESPREAMLEFVTEEGTRANFAPVSLPGGAPNGAQAMLMTGGDTIWLGGWFKPAGSVRNSAQGVEIGYVQSFHLTE